MATDTWIYRLCITIYMMMQLQKKLACAFGGLKHCICHRSAVLMLSSTAHPDGVWKGSQTTCHYAAGMYMYHVLGYRRAPQVAAV